MIDVAAEFEVIFEVVLEAAVAVLQMFVFVVGMRKVVLGMIPHVEEKIVAVLIVIEKSGDSFVAELFVRERSWLTLVVEVVGIVYQRIEFEFVE